ncbi:hypothetical protein [Aliiruegeria lutimaris]|uniref:Dolichyl-phosphate-mannose-protein mannosyltransferase n=1 Tax=Aliiruegeria lutimaris TaxID=571298 RepID=A0A1G9FSV5_9RHOB|nr:hypothetical protein [Aliiruegeria lutimaris]SDK91460.1 hypothetical protein SAMN04488026_105913 [Aliiruegeria lutimaris]
MSFAEAPNELDRAVGRSAAQRQDARLLRRVAFGALIGLFFGVQLGAIYGRMMNYGLTRDEMMFVPPAAFLPDWQLYSDVFFNHVPLSAWYFRAVHIVFGDLGLLEVARTGVFLAWLLLVLGIAWTAHRISGSRMLAAFSAISVITSTPLLTQAGMAATNNLLPLPLAVLGLGLFISETIEERLRFAQLVAVGICLSLAAGIKVSAMMFIPMIAVGAFFLPVNATLGFRLARVVLPLLIGGLLGALPLFWFLASDPQRFLAHILGFHTGPHVAYWQANAASEPGLALGLAGKVELAFAAWLSGAALILVTVLSYLGWVALRDTAAGKVREDGFRGQFIVVFGTILLVSGLSFVPTPGFPQYYVPPLVCLPILCALFYRRLRNERRLETVPVFAASIFMMLLVAAPRLGLGLVALTDREDFTTTRIARGGMAIKQALAANDVPNGPVATFLPIYPLEAGLPVYPEFATGQFAYRIAPYTEPQLARMYRMVGEAGLPELFARTPPAAFLLGYENDLEAPMLRYAQENGYREIDVPNLDNRYGDGRLFIRTPENGS